MSITESLTSLQTTKLKDARGEYGFGKIWTSDRRIMVIEEEPTKSEVLYGKLMKQICCTLRYGKSSFKGNYLLGIVTTRHIMLFKGHKVTIMFFSHAH